MVVGRQLGGGVVDVVGGRFVYRRCQVDAAPAGGASGGHSRRPADRDVNSSARPAWPPKKKKKGSLGVEKLDDYAVVRRFLNFRIFNRGFWRCGGAADSGSLGKHSSVGLLGRCRTMGHPVESCAPNWVLLICVPVCRLGGVGMRALLFRCNLYNAGSRELVHVSLKARSYLSVCTTHPRLEMEESRRNHQDQR